MGKKIFTVVLASIFALAMFGCSSNSASSQQSQQSSSNNSTQQESESPKDLILADSNYVITNGYVKFALEIQNPNENYAADYINVTVTGKHKDGSIGFSDDWTVSNSLPGSTSYWASQAGDGDTVKSDKIEISISVDEDNWSKTDQKMPEALYTFDNVSVKPDKFSGLAAKGEITLNEDFSYETTDAYKPMVVCILKDEKGKIITGFDGFIDKDLTVGKATAFDINGYIDDVKYKTVEMYANMWS